MAVDGCRQLLALTAAGVNREHCLAQRAAEGAIAHAIRCGELLAEVKASLPHGAFGAWIRTNCEFSAATAGNYMRAARNPRALGKSLRHLFPSGRPKLNEAPPDWLPPRGEVAAALAPHGYVECKESAEYPGHFEIVRAWIDDAPGEGGSLDYLGRPIALRKVPGYPLVNLFGLELHALNWIYDVSAGSGADAR